MSTATHTGTMTIEEARAVWERERRATDEGWLDIQVRIERRRTLTEQEGEAAEVLWKELVAAIRGVATVLGVVTRA